MEEIKKQGPLVKLVFETMDTYYNYIDNALESSPVSEGLLGYERILRYDTKCRVDPPNQLDLESCTAIQNPDNASLHPSFKVIINDTKHIIYQQLVWEGNLSNKLYQVHQTFIIVPLQPLLPLLFDSSINLCTTPTTTTTNHNNLAPSSNELSLSNGNSNPLALQSGGYGSKSIVTPYLNNSGNENPNIEQIIRNTENEKVQLLLIGSVNQLTTRITNMIEKIEDGNNEIPTGRSPKE
ncbi:hypothetical protein ACTFIU_010779 [Dictyostelium citrinum]